jgi:hypothetical protein
MSRAHKQGLGVAVKLPLLRRYKAKERRRLLRSVGNYKLYTVGLLMPNSITEMPNLLGRDREPMPNLLGMQSQP